MFEDFKLSENIALGCGEIVGNPSEGVCGYQMSGGISVFNSGMSDCLIPAEGDVHDGLCYHVPVPDNKLFNS